jgi:zinc protease
MVKKEEDISYVRDEVYRTLEDFKVKPVEQKKLNDLKRRNKYGFLMGLDTPDNVAGGLARYVALTGGIGIVDQLYSQFDKVTPQEIAEAASRYFVPERRSFVVLKGAKQ